MFNYFSTTDCSGPNPSLMTTSTAMAKHSWETSQSRQQSASMMNLTARMRRKNRMTGKMRKMTTMTTKRASKLRAIFAAITKLLSKFCTKYIQDHQTFSQDWPITKGASEPTHNLHGSTWSQTLFPKGHENIFRTNWMVFPNCNFLWEIYITASKWSHIGMNVSEMTQGLRFFLYARFLNIYFISSSLIYVVYISTSIYIFMSYFSTFV